MNSELEKLSFPFDPVWERICKLTGWKKYGQLANFLDISSASVSGAKQRRFISLEWIYKVATNFNSSTEWLATGEGPMKRTAEVVNQNIGDNAKNVQQVATGHHEGDVYIYNSAPEPHQVRPEVAELVLLLDRYGNKAMLDDIKQKLLRIKQVTD